VTRAGSCIAHSGIVSLLIQSNCAELKPPISVSTLIASLRDQPVFQQLFLQLFAPVTVCFVLRHRRLGRSPSHARRYKVSNKLERMRANTALGIPPPNENGIRLEPVHHAEYSYVGPHRSLGRDVGMEQS
jgi:hypothetical protein